MVQRIIILLCIGIIVSSQTIRPISSVQIPGKPVALSYDAYGFVYIADEKGNMYKLDSLGKQMVNYSPPRRGTITSIEAFRNVNIFIFYRDFQVFYYIDRFLNATQTLQFNPDKVGYARIATPALDQSVWLVDETDFSLKKYNTTYNSLDINTPLDLIIDPKVYDMNFMREYQNLLFINDATSGILIFDNMGNYKTKLPVVGLTYFSFVDDYLVYSKGDGKIHKVHLYTYKDVIIESSEFTGMKEVYIVQQKIFGIKNNSIFIYSY
ncbi:MAG: hypothetical protein MUE33_07350 [Cytophagaceae bacterium]|jgi:hypothetical protein|nr:hypothetical protein [Cytophagaceae bacterium]